MMKKLFLFMSLALFTFMVGQAQINNAKAPQAYDAQLEEIYGPAPYSEELPPFIKLPDPTKGDDWGLSGIVAYGSLVTSPNAGKFYQISFNESSVTTALKSSYSKYYVTSAECVGTSAGGATVYAFGSTKAKGFGTLASSVNQATGTVTVTGAFSTKKQTPYYMTDLTYNYAKGIMYGLRYGKIYKIDLETGAGTQVSSDDDPYTYIAIACDTYGNMYAVTQSTSEYAKLVKFTATPDGPNFDYTSEDPETEKVVGVLPYPTLNTQSMTYDHNRDVLIWWQGHSSGRHIVRINPEDAQVVGTAVNTSTALGGLFVPYLPVAHSVEATVAPEGTATVTLDKTQAIKGEVVTVTVTPSGCNEVASVVTSPSNLTVTKGQGNTYTFNMGGVLETVTVNIKEHKTVSGVTLDASALYACNGGTITLTAEATLTGNDTEGEESVVYYQWYLNGDEEGSPTTTQTLTVDNEKGGTWTVKATTQFDKEGETSAEVAIEFQSRPTPTPVIAVSEGSHSQVCPNGETTLEISNIDDFGGSGENAKITWKDGAGNTLKECLISAGTDITIENIQAAMSVTATVTEYLPSGEGETGIATCPATSEPFPITIAPTPTVTISGDNTVCFGEKEFGTLSANVKGGVAGLQWYKGTSQISGATDATYKVYGNTTTATYYVEATYGLDGCTVKSEGYPVTVYPGISISFTEAPEKVCGTEGTFAVVPVTNATYYTWYVDGIYKDSGAVMTSFTAEGLTTGDTGVAAGDHTVKVMVECNNKCYAELEHSFHAYPAPQITFINGDVTVCSNGGKQVFSIEPVAGASNYIWTFNKETKSGAELTSVEFDIPTVTENIAYSVSVVAEVQGICNADGHANMEVNALPVVEIQEATRIVQSVSGGDSIVQVENGLVCLGGTYTFHVKDADTEKYTYQWSFNGNEIVGATNTSYTVNNADYPNSGEYSVTATTKAEPNCTSEPAALPLTVNPAPQFGEEHFVDYEEEICYGYSTMLEYFGDFELTEVQFTWYKKNAEGEWDVVKDAVGADTYDTGELTEDATYKLRCSDQRAQEGSRCWAETEEMTVQVKQNIPVVITSSLNNIEEVYQACNGGTIDFIVYNPDNFEEGSYLWLRRLVGAAEFDTIDDETESEFYEQDSKITTATGSTFEYQVIATDGSCNYSSEVLKVYINKLPTITITAPTKTCVGVETTLVAETDFECSFSWYVDPSLGIEPVSSSESTYTFVASKPLDDEFKFTVTATDKKTGCSAQDEVEIKVNPLPEVAIISPVAYSTYNMALREIPLTATNNGTEPGGSFKLDGEDYDETTIDLMLLTVGDHTVTYTYTNENGCVNDTTITFAVEKLYWSDEDIISDENNYSWYEYAEEGVTEFYLIEAGEYGYFTYLLNSGKEDFEGLTVTLLDSINLAGRLVEPHSGFKGVFDFNGYIIDSLTLCDTLEATIANEGVIRNINIRNAKVYTTTTATDGKFVNNGTIANGLIENSTFRFMGEKPYTIDNNGLVDNFYLVGNEVLPYELQLTIEGEFGKNCFSRPAINFGGFTIPNFTSAEKLCDSLNTWVENLNVADYQDWTLKTFDYKLKDTIYHQFPVLEGFAHMSHYNVNLERFVGGSRMPDSIYFMHRSNIQPYEEYEKPVDLPRHRHKEKHGIPESGDIMEWVYGFAGDTVTLSIMPDTYCAIKSVNVVTKGGIEVPSYDDEETGYTYFCMPFDTLNISVEIAKDYWTDYVAENDFDWYNEGAIASHIFQINNVGNLAALACIVNGINLPEGINQYNFSHKVQVGETEVIVPDTVSFNFDGVCDLEEHLWRPIEGFNGVFEGLADYIYGMHSIDKAAGLFAELGPQAEVRNLGIRDAQVQTDYSPVEDDPHENGAAAIAVTNYGKVINCYVTNTIIDGVSGTTGVVVANNKAGAKVLNTYGGILTYENNKYFAFNAETATSASNYAEFATTETGVKGESDAAAMLTGLNNYLGDVLRDNTYYAWKEDKDTENYDFPIFEGDPYYYVTCNTTGLTEESGNLSVSPTYGLEGAKIGITAEAGTGYDRASLTATDANGVRLDIIDDTFILPASNVTVSVVYEKHDYNITYSPGVGPGVNNYIKGPSIANYNHEVEVEVHAEGGFEITTLKANGNDVDLTTKKFIMPANDVAVTAEFDGIEHDLTFVTMLGEKTDTYGTITATVDGTSGVTKARNTHTVNVSIAPNPGYTFVSATVNGFEYDQNEFSFTMPNDDVEITAVFKEGYWTDEEVKDITWYDPQLTYYELNTANKLGGLSYLVNGYYNGKNITFEGKTIKITADIDLAQYKWRPIGGVLKSTYGFNGTFDGDGHKITNMACMEPTGTNIAFFGVVNGGTINNVDLQGAASGQYYVAGIVGKLNKGTVMNCVSNVEVTTKYEGAGIVANNYGAVKNCYNRGSITNTTVGSKAMPYVGGIVALNNSTGSIENVYNVGELAGKGSGTNGKFGGIVGKNGTTTAAIASVKNAYWFCEVLKDIHGRDSIIGTKNGCGTATSTKPYIDGTCHSFTREEGQAPAFVNELDNYVGKSPILLNWTSGTGEYLYPVFVQDINKGEEITDIDENVSSDINVNLYPNPAKDYVRIECEGITRITVVNMLGQVVINQNYDTDNVMLHVNDMTPGVYTVNVVTVNGNFTKNLVVTR